MSDGAVEIVGNCGENGTVNKPAAWTLIQFRSVNIHRSFKENQLLLRFFRKLLLYVDVH